MKKGDIVELTFLDHCTHDGTHDKGPITCTAIGKVVALKPGWVTLASWWVVGTPLDSNSELCTILRSVILKTRRLK